MAVIEGGTTFSLQEVGLGPAMGAHVVTKPIPHGSLGHYRYSVRIISTAAQAANSRIFELRNTAANNIILTRLTLRAIQVAAGTLQENSLDVFRCTAFTAVDTTNTVTPTTSVKRTAGMAAFPGGAAPRHLTITGVAAGMTGGTLTKDGNMFATFPYMVTAGVATATYQPPQWGPYDCVDDVNGTHPFVFAQNEGFIIENRVLNVTSMGIAWYIDVSWAEATAY
jgi:hypothetical protein